MANNNEMLWEGEEVGEIAGWYNNRTIFITGGTGFMGKVLVEKLLYSCPGLKRIYVLMRPKRGVMPEKRLEEIFKLPVFQRIRKEFPERFKKIIPMHGDVLSERLGLTKSARERLIEEVSVVYHVAATLKLEAKLRDSIEHNAGGTAKVIELCKEMRNLASFIHVSTAFCNSDMQVMKEKVYPLDCNPYDIIECAKWLKDDALEAATPMIIAPHPNTYLYTKRLAEMMVADEYANLPLAIIRPSIVCPSVREPVPGWVDSLNGPVGLLVGGGKGVIRTMLCNPHYHAQASPVDFCINAMIVVSWKTGTATEKPRDIPVYNLTQDRVKPVTWQQVLDEGKQVLYRNPFGLMLWYPNGDIHTSKIIHNLCVFFFHWIPAYFIDFMMFLFRQPRFMVHVQTRVSQGLELLQFFTMREWQFECENALKLWQYMSSEDRKRFPVDQDSFDMEIKDYLEIAVLGARQYCIKEDLSTLPRARRTLKILYCLDKFVQVMFYGMLFYFLYNYSSTARDFMDLALEYVMDFLQKVPILRSILFSQ